MGTGLCEPLSKIWCQLDFNYLLTMADVLSIIHLVLKCMDTIQRRSILSEIFVSHHVYGYSKRKEFTCRISEGKFFPFRLALSREGVHVPHRPVFIWPQGYKTFFMLNLGEHDFFLLIMGRKITFYAYLSLKKKAILLDILSFISI